MMRQTVTYTELGPAEFRPAISRFIAVYTAAMNPPERMLAGREAILDRHAANPGFRALAAVPSRGDDPPGSPLEWRSSARSHLPLAGFTYGFHGVPGQWWHDTVAGALTLYARASASRGAGGGRRARLARRLLRGRGAARAAVLPGPGDRPRTAAPADVRTARTDSRAVHRGRRVA